MFTSLHGLNPVPPYYKSVGIITFVSGFDTILYHSISFLFTSSLEYFIDLGVNGLVLQLSITPLFVVSFNKSSYTSIYYLRYGFPQL